MGAATVYRLLVVSMLVTLPLTACGTARPDPTTSLAASAASEAGAAGYTEQQRILADHDITAEEYRQAVGHHVDCLRRRGLHAEEPALNPVDGLRLIVEATPNGRSVDDYNAAVGECALRHLSFVEAVYTATHKPVMDHQVRSHTHACLARNAIHLPKNLETAHDMLTAAGADKRTIVIDCIQTSAKELRPDLKTIVIPE
ncbi:MAG: hypothetical protein ACRDTC_28410 [Pseudonocardiaceae bacterium]